jgi:hypothetical protein
MPNRSRPAEVLPPEPPDACPPLPRAVPVVLVPASPPDPPSPPVAVTPPLAMPLSRVTPDVFEP